MNVVVISLESEYGYVEKCLKIPVTVVLWNRFEDMDRCFEMEWENVSYVVVAIHDRSSCEDIKNIVAKWISNEKIIDFFQFYRVSLPMKCCDKVLSNPSNNSIEGIVLGISHAAVGIITDFLKYKFVNLAVSSQDIYYNYKTLVYALKKYPEKLQNVKYIIIDMYRYNYFNYDVSRTRGARDYYQWSGIWDDPHHFDEEEYYSLKEEVLNKRLRGITKEKEKAFDKIFRNIHEVDNYKNYETYSKIYSRNKMVIDDDVLNYNFARGIVLEHFEMTILENIQYFKEMVQLIKREWPSARIILLHMPLYRLAIEKSSDLYKNWETEYLSILADLGRDNNLEYYDYTEHKLSDDRTVWQDFEHLNYQGAIRFTKEINKLL